MPADNVEGFRKDTLELLRQLNAPVYRWPGGNFVSGYDWRDGLGDRDTATDPHQSGLDRHRDQRHGHARVRPPLRADRVPSR